MDDELKQIRRERWLQQKAAASDSATARMAPKTSTLHHSKEAQTPNLRSVPPNDESLSEKSAKRPKKSKTAQTKTSQSTSYDVLDLTATSEEEEHITKNVPKPIDRSSSSFLSASPRTKTIVSNRSSSRAVPLSNAAAEQKSRCIACSVCTYNIWFGPPHQSLRMATIASILTNKMPLFVGLQEVTPYLASELFPLLKSVGYRVIAQNAIAAGCRYGCAIAVLTNNHSQGKNNFNENEIDLKQKQIWIQVLDSGFQPYHDSIMERGLLWVHAVVSSPMSTEDVSTARQHVLFTTTHLESYVANYPSVGQTYDGVKERQSQVLQAKSFCQDFVYERNWKNSPSINGIAFITGDFNWDDERKRSKGMDASLLSLFHDGADEVWYWRDAWLDTRPGNAGYTYDAKENPMLLGNLRRRFDRVLAYLPSSQYDTNSKASLELHSADLIGTEIIEGLEWKKEVPKWGAGVGMREYRALPVLPSDHYGLYVTVEITKIEE